VVRKSDVALTDIPKGTHITDSFLTMKRPGTGLPSFMLPYLIGRQAKEDIPAGTILTLEMLA